MSKLISSLSLVAAFTSVALAAGGSATGADLQVSGSASSGSPTTGAAYSYTFQIKNAGPDTATNASFSDTLPTGTGYVSATVNGAATACSLSNGTVTCNLGPIGKGGQSTVVINVIAPAFVGTFLDVGTASSSTFDPQSSNNSGFVTVQVKSAGGVAIPPPSVLSGPIYLRDSFGYDPPVDGLGFRYDSPGNPVSLFGAAGETSMNQLRVEYPNIASEVWLTPAVRQSPTWYFGPVASLDPATVEPPGSYDRPGENGVVASNVNPTIESNNAALVPFVQPPGPVTASISAIAGWYTTAIGFTPSGALVGNFETSGAAWLVVRMPRTTPGGQGSVATWELHTNGLLGPSTSGSFVLQGYNHLAVSYDPVAGTVVGSINGVPTAALPYTVTGVQYVGFQGNGVFNDFLVTAGAIAPQ